MTAHRPEDVAVCRAALKGLDPAVITEALEGAGDLKNSRRARYVRACLARLFERGIPSRVVAGGMGFAQSVVQHHWREMGLSERDRRAPDLPGEVWRKVTGWKLEVSDHGRVRTLRGCPIKPNMDGGRLRVRYTGADDDPAAKRMFTLASLVLSTFGDHPPTTRARHLDGDLMNCRLANLEPDGVFADRRVTIYHAPIDQAARARCRAILDRAGVTAAVIDHALSGLSFGRRGGGGWAGPDQCIRILVEADCSTAEIASALGILGRVVTMRRERMGIGAAPRIKARRLPGEQWRRIPGFKGQVSSLGRYRGATGALVAGTLQHGRPRITLISNDDGPDRTIMLASIVLAAFRGYPVGVPARHLNGDRLDCRLVNLEIGVQAYCAGAKRADAPWTRGQDNALRRATSYAEAERLTGHTQAYCRKRMRLLGIELVLTDAPRRGRTPPLAYRDLSNIEVHVARLIAAGVGDRTINLGLRIVPPVRGGYNEAMEATARCVDALLDDGASMLEVADAIGVQQSVVGRWKQRLGRSTRRPAGWRTKAGPIDHRDGEEWRQIGELPHMVSSLGRVATGDGYLLTPSLNRRGQPQVSLRAGCRSRSSVVARLVIEAFKPDIPKRGARHLNGDLTDCSIDNLVARLDDARRPPSAAGVYVTGGSVPRAEPLWAQANAIVSPGLESDIRTDLISEMVLMVMDGRAAHMTDAYAKARAALNRTFGDFSLDAPFREDPGSAWIDRLTSTSEFIQSGQIRAASS